MIAKTVGLGLFIGKVIGYKKLNIRCKSCKRHVIFLCVLTLTNFKLSIFYLIMYLKLCLNLRLTSPTPQHVVLLHKLESGYVWPHINFVRSVTEYSRMCDVRIKISVFVGDWINTENRNQWVMCKQQ